MGELVYRLKVKPLLMALCLVLMPFSGFAAGLGKLTVSSSLGEPFKAEIEVLSVSADEIDSLVATMASEETYLAQGITRLSIHSNIEVELSQNPDGSPILKLHSSQPVADSFLDMLIQLDWASGRLLREYSVLLDPPDFKKPNDDTSPLPNALPSTVDSDQPVAHISESIVADTETFTTKPGDNLNDIAKQLQVDGVSLEQMLVGLFDNNKQAFIQGNMNRLKVGKIIKVPSHDTLVAINDHQAKQLLQVHTENWKAYKSSLASQVASAPNPLELDQKQNVSGKITGAADENAPSKTGTQNIVKLSAGVKEPTNPSKEMEAKLTMLQEENTAQAKSLKEAQDRTANLEKQIADMRKLLALNSQVMADLQKNTVANMAKPEVQLNASSPPVAEVALAASSSITDEAVVLNTTKSAKNIESAVTEDGGLMRMRDVVDLSVLIATSALALLFGTWWFIRNKRKKEFQRHDTNALNLSGLRSDKVFGDTANSNRAPDTLILKDFSQSAGGSIIDTNDVDPIAEAEVDMAYGRYEQAEEILKRAILKTPKHFSLHLKLLEIYSAHKNMVAFKSLAGDLYAELGDENPIWAQVAKICSATDPTNALLKTVTISKKKPKATKLKLAGVELSSLQKIASESKEDELEHGGQATAQTNAVDISNTMGDISLDFELDAANKSSINASPVNSAGDQDLGIEKNVRGFDFSSISFDLDAPDNKPVAAKPIVGIAIQTDSAANDSQAVDLKLDLVSAYIEMGDQVGARELLEEVQKIGSKQQKLRAKKLLAKLV